MRTDDEAHGSGWSRAQTEHIYEITEKSLQQQFEGDMIASVFITLWKLLTKCLTVTFVKHSSEDQQ
jgi:hypothetical protein